MKPPARIRTATSGGYGSKLAKYPKNPSGKRKYFNEQKDLRISWVVDFWSYSQVFDPSVRYCSCLASSGGLELSGGQAGGRVFWPKQTISGFPGGIFLQV